MRVTEGMMISTTLNNIAANQSRLEELQNQITSGRKARRPSDDPVAVARAVGLNTDLRQLDQYRRNIDSATGWLNDTETALRQVTDALQRARELAVTGSNTTYTPAQRQAMGTEVSQLFNTLIDVGNAKHAGRFIFSGFNVLTQPFQPASNADGFVYQGDMGQLNVEMAPNTMMALNTPGNRTFPQALQALRQLTQALNTSDLSSVQHGVAMIDTALDANLGELATVGSKVNRASATDQRAQDVSVNKQSELSKVIDVDMSQALLQFSTSQAVYQASLKAAGQALSPSLLDYLK